MDTVKAIVVDDEPILAQELSSLIGKVWPELEVIDVLNNGEQALRVILKENPDIVFLDIRMPELDGLSLLERLEGRESNPLIVFTTAYEKYAVDAFDRDAVDYLLKPIDEKRLEKSVDRLKEKMESRNNGNGVDQISAEVIAEILRKMNIEPQKQYLEWIKASIRDNVHLVSVQDIIFFRAADKYTEVHTGDEEYIIRTSIKELNDQLDPTKFWQINRGTLVNSAYIDVVKKDFAGRLSVCLKGIDDTLNVSRNFKNVFKHM